MQKYEEKNLDMDQYLRECLESQSVFVTRDQVASCQTYHWPCLPYNHV